MPLLEKFRMAPRLLAGALLLAAHPADAADLAVTIMAQERIPPKWLLRDGQADGYCPALLAALERSEPRLRFTGMDNARPLKMIEAALARGTTMAACALADTPQRRALAQAVGKPLYVLRHRLAVAAGDDVVINSMADLVRTHALVNTRRGAAFVDQLKALGVAVDDSSGDGMVNLKKTMAGHGRFTYMGELPMAMYLADDAVRGKVRMLPVVLREEPSYFWVSRKADPEVAKLVERALATLRASGELARIYEHWVHVAELDQPGVSTFKPTMPAMIKPMQPRRSAPAGSPNTSMPTMAVPTVPMPVQIA